MLMASQNSWNASLAELSKVLPRPDAVLVVSAHWITNGSKVSSSKSGIQNPIYDFYGFPEELYQLNYNPPSADLDFLLKQCQLDFDQVDRGLDHGCWGVLKYLFPKADIPVMQLSIDQDLSLSDHWDLAEKLYQLRENNIMIIGSGNVTHNLSEVRWQCEAKALPWVLEFDLLVAKALIGQDKKWLTQDVLDVGSKAHPSWDHWIPLIYIAALRGDSAISFPYDKIMNASLSMRSVLYN